MRRCLDEGDVPALPGAVSLWVPDSVRFALLALAAHLPFPGRGVELSRVFYVHERSSSRDAKVHEVGFLAVKIPNGVSILHALCGVLFLRYATAMNSSPHMNGGKPLSVSMH